MNYFRKSPWKRAGCALTALFLAASLCACGTRPEAVPPQPEAVNAPSVPSALPPDGQLGYRLLCTLPNLNSQTLTLIARGVQDHCDSLGIDVQMHNSHDDHMGQALEVDSFVSGGGQAILCRPVDTATLQPFLQLARQQGVFVVSWDAGAEADATLTVDYQAAGVLLARDAAGWAKGLEARRPPALLLLAEAPLPGFAAGVQQGYAAAFPDEEAEVQTLTAKPDTLAEDLLALEAAPGIILADSDATALLARQLLAEAWAEAEPGAEPATQPDWNSYYFGGFGASLEGLEALVEGTLQATVGENGYEAGRQMVDMAVQLLQGSAVESRQIDPVLVDKGDAAGYNN